jgi:hypothetical protein
MRTVDLFILNSEKTDTNTNDEKGLCKERKLASAMVPQE